MKRKPKKDWAWPAGTNTAPTAPCDTLVWRPRAAGGTEAVNFRGAWTGFAAPDRDPENGWIGRYHQAVRNKFPSESVARQWVETEHLSKEVHLLSPRPGMTWCGITNTPPILHTANLAAGTCKRCRAALGKT